MTMWAPPCRAQARKGTGGATVPLIGPPLRDRGAIPSKSVTAGTTGRWLLEGLDEVQLAAVTSEAAPLCVEAGPGSGKTRVLTRRVAWRSLIGAADPKRILVLTFTRAAASELRRRLSLLGVADATIGTFHGVCLARLARRYADIGKPPPTLTRARDRILGAAIARGGAAPLSVAQLGAELSWASSRLLTPAEYPAAAAAASRDIAAPYELVAEMFLAYEDEKQARRVIDVDDLPRLILHELDRDAEWANTMRWWFRHVYVDEYQDTSVAQRRILQHLCHDGDLFIVGDPRQSIYGFAGVAADTMNVVATDFPGTRTIVLTRNHRSPADVVAAADAILPTGTALSDLGDPVVTVTPATNEADEARRVVAAIRRLGPGRGSVAVLARTNAVLDVVEGTLRSAGFAVDRSRSLLRHPEVQRILDHWRTLPANRPAASLRGDLAVEIDDILQALQLGDRDGFDDQPDDVDLDDLVGDDDREPAHVIVARHHLAEFADRYDEFCTEAPNATVDLLLFWLESIARDVSVVRSPRGAIRLRTIHAAKGLEWDDVFLVGCEADTLPLPTADPDEERRLFFVAVTRAAKRLHCSWAERRADRYGRVWARKPSPFLAEITDAVERVAEARTPTTPPPIHLAALRTRVDTAAEQPRCRRARRIQRPDELIRAAVAARQAGTDPPTAVIGTLARLLRTTPDELLGRAELDERLRREIDDAVLNACAAAIRQAS